jgi:hypothetical protein
MTIGESHILTLPVTSSQNVENGGSGGARTRPQTRIFLRKNTRRPKPVKAILHLESTKAFRMKGKMEMARVCFNRFNQAASVIPSSSQPPAVGSQLKAAEPAEQSRLTNCGANDNHDANNNSQPANELCKKTNFSDTA